MKYLRVNTIQILCLLPASLFLIPVIVAAALGLIGVIAVSLFSESQPLQVKISEIRGALALLLLLVTALAGFAATWAALLVGADRVKAKVWQRRVIQTAIALGIAAGFYWLFWMQSQMHSIGFAYWAILLIAPITVGARQFYLLSLPKRHETELPPH